MCETSHDNLHMGIEALALLIVKAILPVVAARLAAAGLPQERVLRWLRRDPPRLAMRSALIFALASVRERHPAETSAFFDEVFLSSVPVAALLARCVPPPPQPTAGELAGLYVDHLGPASDRERAVNRALPVAEDFLGSLREQLRHSEPFRVLFDSDAADSAAISLAQLVDTLPDLLARLDLAPARLRMHVKSLSTVREQRSANFIGREHVMAAIDDRLLDPGMPNGYIVIRGEPGIGKSAIMAELVRTRDYVHHFNVVTGGVRSADQFLRNVCAQLILRYGLPYQELPADAGRDNSFLDVALRDAISAAAAAGERQLVIAVDALDEAEKPLEGANRLLLPHDLPDRVYVVTTIRSGVDDMLDVARRAEPIDLREDDPLNLADLHEYVRDFLHRRDDVMFPRLHEWETSSEAFADLVTERSEGNFMYAWQVLEGIASGDITKENFGSLDGLPSGLVNYYRRHWRSMRDADEDRFDRVQRPVIGVLATAPAAVSAAKLTEWVNDSGYFSPIERRDVDRVLAEWRQFLNKEPGNPPRWRIYHLSFLEFLAKELDLDEYLSASNAAIGSKVRWDA